MNALASMLTRARTDSLRPGDRVRFAGSRVEGAVAFVDADFIYWAEDDGTAHASAASHVELVSRAP